MGVKAIGLSEIERETLRGIIKKGADWRERDRAESILALSEGKTVAEVAEKQGLKPETVRERRRKWLKWGFASLPERQRSGAPSKLTEEHRGQLRQWVEAEALTSRVLLTRLEQALGVRIGATTLRNELKRLGYVWKRTRYSLKKSATRDASGKPKGISPL
jgi:transposase